MIQINCKSAEMLAEQLISKMCNDMYDVGNVDLLRDTFEVSQGDIEIAVQLDATRSVYRSGIPEEDPSDEYINRWSVNIIDAKAYDESGNTLPVIISSKDIERFLN